MNKKKTGIKLMVIIFFLIMVVDIISTYANGRDLVQYLEANPLYPHVWLIILLNFAWIGFTYWLYKRSKSVRSDFALLNCLVTMCVIRAIVVYNNFKIAMDPPTIQQAMQITQAMKTAAVVKLGIMALVPYLIGYLTFLVFTLDHKVEMKEGKK